MTEIVAAHLERVAKEVHDAVERGYTRWDEAGRCDPSCVCVTVYIEQEIKLIWAAALAACARESEKPLLKALQEVVATLSEFLSWKESQYDRRQRAIKIAQEALERAVGEK